jgi:hypothetical protein
MDEKLEAPIYVETEMQTAEGTVAISLFVDKRRREGFFLAETPQGGHLFSEALSRNILREFTFKKAECVCLLQSGALFHEVSEEVKRLLIKALHG